MAKKPLEGQPSLSITRHYNVAPEKVCFAWTDSEALKERFKPDDSSSILQQGRRQKMTTATGKAIDEAQIRALIDDRVKAVRAKDSNAATSGTAPDILSFDVVNPLQRIGSDASRKRAEEWFASFRGPIGLEIRDLSITASDDVAFSHGLSHVSATTTAGVELDMWWRTTLCFRKIDGKWMITHEHNSVPFDVESGKASLDLKPQ